MPKRSASTDAAKASSPKALKTDGKNCSVEEYLQEQCDALIEGLNSHAEKLMGKMRKEYDASVEQLRKAASQQGDSDSDAPKHVYVEMDVQSGPYAGKKFSVCPGKAPKNVSFVGRSTGKKFRDLGLSLPKDGEVSTTHAKIEQKKNKIIYTDTGSTNGSYIAGEEIFEGDAHELLDGTLLRFGNTEVVIKITTRV